MSSEDLVEQCHEGRGAEAELPCGGSPPRGRLRQGESGGGDHCGTQEVTSGGGMERVQREKEEEVQRSAQGERRGFSQKGESQDGGPDVCLLQCDLRRSDADRAPDHQAEEPRGPGPFFFFGGANGAALVCTYCESRGWRRIYNKHREDFRLKWCETKSPANYHNFREGEQLVYQIPNNKVLTTKIGLLSSLREFERVSSKVNHGRLRRLKMEEFIPATFRMDMREEREAFFAQQEDVSNKESQMWICKPTGLNQGRGIFLLQSQEDVAALRLKLQELQELQESRASRRRCFQPPQARIVQRYIQKPLLLKGRKFDVRSYLLIACTAPYMVFFRHGYVRLTCDLYDPSSSSLSAHLTNQYMQKKNPLYSLLKEDTVWSIESFNAYVNDKYRAAKGLPRDWVKGPFAKRMQQIMTQCFFAVKSKLDRRLGFFDLIGCDFMIDDEFNVWLLEMNCNPALHTNCEVLKDVIPSTVKETLDITLEIFTKSRCRQQILPLVSQREFLLLHSGAFPPASVLPGGKNTLGGSTLKSPCHQKSTKKNPKTEGTICKSGNAGKPASVSSSDTSVDVSETATEYEEPSGQVPLNAVPCEMTEALGNNGSLPEPTRPRTEHKTSRCALDRQQRSVDHLRPPEEQQKKRSIRSKSTAALSGRTQSSISHSASTKSARKPDAAQSSRSSLQPKQVPLSPPHVGRPVWVDTHDKGNQPGEEELTEDTNGLAFDKKEEL